MLLSRKPLALSAPRLSHAWPGNARLQSTDRAAAWRHCKNGVPVSAASGAEAHDGSGDTEAESPKCLHCGRKLPNMTDVTWHTGHACGCGLVYRLAVHDIEPFNEEGVTGSA